MERTIDAASQAFPRFSSNARLNAGFPVGRILLNRCDLMIGFAASQHLTCAMQFGYGIDPFYYVLTGLFMLLSWLAGLQLRRKVTYYSQIPVGLTGEQVARKMLMDHGIVNVEVTAVPGELTDHYHPVKRTVNLSEGVYGSASLAAAAVAAHECGHAVQHAKAYPALQMRSALVPVVTFSTQLAQFVLMAGLVLTAMGAHLGAPVFLLGIVLFSTSTLFSFITLPVEFDASRRALVWLERSGVASGRTHEMARDALKWAAMTYVVAALASLGQLFYFILLFLRSRR